MAGLRTGDNDAFAFFDEDFAGAWRQGRSDIRADPDTGALRPGVPLELSFVLSQVGASTCGPLAGALVDLWHCDALGVYSDVADQRTVGQRFLRGYQVSDANGGVRFTTVYPGWYPGRAVHMHFKVRTNPAGSRGLELTSQGLAAARGRGYNPVGQTSRWREP
jgi:protocatechuate 3,4-dioxygenase beta subunit